MTAVRQSLRKSCEANKNGWIQVYPAIDVTKEKFRLWEIAARFLKWLW